MQYGIRLFSKGHPFENLRQATFADVRRHIAPFNYSQIWGTSDLVQDPRRQAIRPPAGVHNGTATAGNLHFPQSGAWLSCPGENTVYLLRNDTVTFDDSQAAWLEKHGILGDYQPVRSLHSIRQDLVQTDRRLYCCDDYGPSFTGLTVNSAKDFAIVNSKKWVSRLVGERFRPLQRIKDMQDIDDRDFFAVSRNGDPVYIKTCNLEHGGMGVQKASNPSEFAQVIAELRRQAAFHNLDSELVVQRGYVGRLRSFSVFLVPDQTEIMVTALTDQLVNPESGRDLGNCLYPISAGTIEPIGGLILDVIGNIRQYCPEAFGFVMVDFMETSEGEQIAFDPGLRISGSGPPAMALLWLHSRTGKWPYIRSDFRFETGRPGFNYEALLKCAGRLGDCDCILKHCLGVLPYGMNPNDGSGRLMLVAPDKNCYPAVLEQVRSCFARCAA
jgi:hypothetical protein